MRAELMQVLDLRPAYNSNTDVKGLTPLVGALTRTVNGEPVCKLRPRVILRDPPPGYRAVPRGPVRCWPTEAEVLAGVTIHWSGGDSPFWLLTEFKPILTLPALQSLTVSCTVLGDDLADGLDTFASTTALTHLELVECFGSQKALTTVLALPRALRSCHLGIMRYQTSPSNNYHTASPEQQPEALRQLRLASAHHANTSRAPRYHLPGGGGHAYAQMPLAHIRKRCVEFLQQSRIAGYIKNLDLDVAAHPGSVAPGLLMRILPILVSVTHLELFGGDWSSLPHNCVKAILAFGERQHLQYLHVGQFPMAFYTVLCFARLALVVTFHKVPVPAFMDVHLSFFNKPRKSPPLRRLSWMRDPESLSVTVGTLLTWEEFAPDMAELRVLEVMVDDFSWVVIANMIRRCMRTVEVIRIHLHYGALAFALHRTSSRRNGIIVPAAFIERIPHLPVLRWLEFAIKIKNTPSPSECPSWPGLCAVLLSPATIPALTELTFTYLNLFRTTDTHPSDVHPNDLRWYPLKCDALANLDIHTPATRIFNGY
ncbi:hypothetical protein B0H14DRAFT_2587656 [Mycena olivaceomarginata]|nr:hypothetical protein B0H14DRAFT_2587656 [Mycena olivaceomarginata]